MKIRGKIVTGMVLMAVSISAFTGCDNKPRPITTNTAQKEQITLEAQADQSAQVNQEGIKSYDTLGIKIQMEGPWKEYSKNLLESTVWDTVSGLMVDFSNDEALKASEAEKNNKLKEDKKWSNAKRLFVIASFETGKVSMDFLTDMVGGPDREAEVEKISENNGRTYYFCWYKYDDSGLSDESKAKYKKLYDDLKNLKKNIETFEPTHRTTISDTKKVVFTTKDLNGNEVSSDIFKNNKITMVNIWATFCNPCIKEMPDIQVLNDELKEKGISVIGIVGDSADDKGNVDEDYVQLAKTILEKKKINYTNLVFNKEMVDNLPVDAYPTTLLIDSEGNVIGKPIMGSKTKEEYEQIILKALDNLEK